MKIQVVNTITKAPLSNFKLQLQVKGKNSGFLTVTTDSQGYFILDEKYNGQFLATYMNGILGEWTTVSDEATLYANIKTTTTDKDKHTHST